MTEENDSPSSSTDCSPSLNSESITSDKSTQDDAESSSEYEYEKYSNSKKRKSRKDEGGMGDVMSKILKKPIRKSNVPVLAKRKTKIMKEREKEEKEELLNARKINEKRENRNTKLYIPDETTLHKEKQLKKIATRGVVALFNAIAQQQASQKNKERENEISFSAEVKKRQSKFLFTSKNLNTIPNSSVLSAQNKKDIKIEDAVPFKPLPSFSLNSSKQKSMRENWDIETDSDDMSEENKISSEFEDESD